MGDCPSTECHDSVQGMKRTLYGPDGTGGIVKCLAGKLSRKATLGVMLTILSIVTVFAVRGLDVWAEQENKINKNTIQIEKIGVELKNIKETVTRIERNQLKKEDLKQIIKDALRSREHETAITLNR